jgi:N6-L-threonylcarbamoyladenine synthase
MKILAIETSCDETSLSLFTATETASGVDFDVHSTITQSQIDIHQEFGGVFPALAKREHQKNLVPILLKILNREVVLNSEVIHNVQIETILERESQLLESFMKHVMPISNPGIDAICVTSGPGLEPALWVGISFAKALGVLWDIPVIPVNHMEGHILSVLVPENNSEQGTIFSVQHELFPFPALALLISGGHTELVLVKGLGQYEIIGKTRDDAVGEAFDKVARILGLPYPGGPEVSKLAALYSPSPNLGEGWGEVVLPRPMIHSKDYDFSFSGLKTATLYLTNDIKEKNNGIIPENLKTEIAHEFQEAAAEVITKKTRSVMNDFGVQTLIVGGGVSANNRIKESLIEKISEIIPRENIHFPIRELTGDNALMIGLAGYFKYKKNPDINYQDFRAEGNLSF